MFKFNDRDNRENLERNINEMKEKLDALPQIISEIRNFETGVNINPNERAWDLVLVSEFESMEDLEKYRVHPAHQEVVKFFKPLKDMSASVDYEYEVSR
jgi:hypothetical protein